MDRRPTTPAFLLALFCLVSLPQGYGQKADTAGLISVSLRIVGEGLPIHTTPPDTIPGFFAVATLTNREDTTIHFWVMSCSWSVHNFVTSNHSVDFRIPLCTHNFPEKIDLMPQHWVDFYGYFRPVGHLTQGDTVKLGFIYFTSDWDLMEYTAGKKQLRKFAVYWSNSAYIADHLYQYQVN